MAGIQVKLALVAGIPIIFGVFIFLYAVVCIRISLAARAWPKVMGRVIDTRMVEVRRHRRWSVLYQPTITYEYEIGGLPYRSERMGFGDSDFLGDAIYQDRWAAEEVLARHKPGTPIEVRYDPNDPSRAVLRTGINKGHVATAAFGVLLIAIGVGCLLNTQFKWW